MNDIVISDNNVDAIRELTAELGNSVAQIDMLYLKIGALLTFIKEHKLYTFYASHTETWRDYLKEIDLGIGVSQADHLIRVYKTFGDKMEGRKIALKRLLLIHPLCKDEASRDELLNVAENTPWQGLVDCVKERKGKVTSDNCLHPPESITTHYRCAICGLWLRGK